MTALSSAEQGQGLGSAENQAVCGNGDRPGFRSPGGHGFADAKQTRRILAIAMVLDGHSRLLAARAGGMDGQTLRDWVIRYNADDLAGLADRPRSSLAREDGAKNPISPYAKSVFCVGIW